MTRPIRAQRATAARQLDVVEPGDLEGDRAGPDHEWSRRRGLPTVHLLAYLVDGADEPPGSERLEIDAVEDTRG